MAQKVKTVIQLGGGKLKIRALHPTRGEIGSAVCDATTTGDLRLEIDDCPIIEGEPPKTEAPNPETEWRPLSSPPAEGEEAEEPEKKPRTRTRGSK